MRMNVKVELPFEVQQKLFKIATSSCKNLDATNSKRVTTRFIKDKVNSLLGIKLQGIVYKDSSLILQVDNNYKFGVIKKHSTRISNYLSGITKKI